MSPTEALQILEQMRLQVSMSGANNDQVKQAIQVLAVLVKENEGASQTV